MASSHRPDLREPVLRLLEKLVPAVRSGGDVSLTELVVAVTGDKLAPAVKSKLDARGAARIAAGDPSRFENAGPAVTIELKRFNLKIPKLIAGGMKLSGDGVMLTFDPKASLLASKLFLSIRFEAIELTSGRIDVTMEQSAFDQKYDLT